jgi:hypothetical protein
MQPAVSRATADRSARRSFHPGWVYRAGQPDLIGASPDSRADIRPPRTALGRSATVESERDQFDGRRSRFDQPSEVPDWSKSVAVQAAATRALSFSDRMPHQVRSCLPGSAAVGGRRRARPVPRDGVGHAHLVMRSCGAPPSLPPFQAVTP